MQTSHAAGGRHRTRRLAAGVVLGLALPAMASCGFKTQTNEKYQPAVGTNVQESRVDVLGNVVVAPEDGSGVYVATLSNNSQDESDTLESITGADGTTVTLAKPIEIPPASIVNLADDGGIPVEGKTVNVTDSSFVSLTLTFTNADPVKVEAVVVRNDGPYADLGAPRATPSAPNSVAAGGSQGAFGTPAS